MTTQVPGSGAGPVLPRRPELPSLLPGMLLADPDPADVRRGRARRSVRDWIVDALCFIVAVVIGLMSFDTAMQTEPPELVQLADVVIGAAFCLTLWWRRRWPVQLALAGAVLSTAVASSVGASLILIFTVAVHRRYVVAVAVSLLHMGSGALFYEIYPDPEMSYQAALAFTALGLVAVTLWGMFVRARRQLVLSLRERTYQAESETTLREERARHLERERIAREMHDVLAHRLSLLSVHAGALEYRPGMPADDVARAASVIRASSHQALQDLREVIGVLRTTSADDPDRPQPTLDDVAALVAESQQAGMRIMLIDHRDDHTQPPQAVARCAYRVIQEGLTNVRKHANGVGVQVTLRGRPDDGLEVDVTNRNPVGTADREAIPGAGTGLVGLGERVDLAGGRLEHGPTPDGDFRVHAWLPWPP